MSTPPSITAQLVSSAPMTYKYQLPRLILGNAMSRAPTINGTKKLPSTAGTAGIKKKNNITMPCIVNSLL